MDINTGKVYRMDDPDIPEEVREHLVPLATPKAYWNGLETTAIRGTAIVAEAPEFPNYWAQELVGVRIDVVEIILDGVNAGGGIAHLDNRDGTAWLKVTEGGGSPQLPHRNVNIVPGSFAMSEEDRERYYKELQELKELKESYEKIVEMTGPWQGNRADRRAASKNSRKKKRFR